MDSDEEMTMDLSDPADLARAKKSYEQEVLNMRSDRFHTFQTRIQKNTEERLYLCFIGDFVPIFFFHIRVEKPTGEHIDFLSEEMWVRRCKFCGWDGEPYTASSNLT